MSSIIKLSLCITTKNRYDTFLSNYLDHYVSFLKEGLIDELIISDETGSDYDKIIAKYGHYINNQTKFKVFKNEKILGVFKNKLKVCSYASNEYIALIDSDNFCDRPYFETAINYINKRSVSFDSHVIIAPSFSKPCIFNNMRFFNDFSEFANIILTKDNMKTFNKPQPDGGNHKIYNVLNTGNYILSKSITEQIKYDDTIMEKITSCDVVYFNLLAFQQFPGFQFHIVKDLEYTHNVHADSEYLKTFRNCEEFSKTFVMEEYKKL